MSRTVRHIVRGMRSHDTGDLPEASSTRSADLRLMREHNRHLVLNCVREHGPIARAEVARRTGLSRTTVSAIMDILLRDGLVREGSMQSAAPSGGRRAILVHFNASAGCILGVDMGRTHLTIALSDLAGSILARRPSTFDVDCGPEAGLSRLIAELRACLDEHQIRWAQIVGVGVGMPGPMDAALQRPVAPPRMPGWDGVDVRGALARALGVPVYLDNDANMGALGESRYGAGAGVADMAYVKIGSGIGGGLVMGGRIYRGSRGSAGEIGHVTVDEDGPLCDCGNRGCLETLAAAPAIVEDARRGLSLAQGNPSGAPFSGEPALDVADVIRAALAGDPACRAAIERAGERIGVVLAGLVNLVNPSLVLIGGQLAGAGDLLLEPMRRAVVARSFSIASAHLEIRAGALEDAAIALGGIAMVLDAAFGTAAVGSQHTVVHRQARASRGGEGRRGTLATGRHASADASSGQRSASAQEGVT